MATQDEILDQISEDIESGVKRRRSNDREVEKFSPEERVKGAKALYSAEHSPFVRVGLKSREV